MSIELTVNGALRVVKAHPAERLSTVLRDHIGMKGTKVGCDAGDCGACTVLLNGEMICACLTSLDQAQGCSITTVEGLAKTNGLPGALQNSFLRHGAAQCGICTPGMLMAATQLLAEKPSPTKAEVEDALGGVLCRCTGYAKIIAAVLDVAKMRDSAAPSAGKSVGASIARLDGLPKVMGTDRFGADTVPQGALLVRVVRSPHHAARFRFGDLDQYVKSTPGIRAVLTAADVPGTNRFGVIPLFIDQPVFAERTVRFRGEAVAAIVGDPDVVATLELDAFPVSWEKTPHQLAVTGALAPGASPIQKTRPNNILVQGHVERGDVEAGLSAAAHTIADQFTTPFIEHAYIEPEAGYAVRNGDRITIFGCTQAPHLDLESIAAIMGLEKSQVQVVPSACGGGFGSKLDLSFQPFVALAAWKLNCPAYIHYTRTESMQSTTKRHPSTIRVTAGCDAEGKITALDFTGDFNTGAYASWGPTVANRVPVHASGPYFTPNYRAHSRAILTNCMPSGAFRGFGVPQSLVAVECLYDQLADKVGIDRLEFRLRNALRNGQPTVTGQVFVKGVGIFECLSALKPAWSNALALASSHNRKTNGQPLRKGVGLATCWYGCGNTSLPNPSTIRMGVTRDGRIVLHQGATDIGQGSNTVITQIAADALAVAVEQIAIVGPDTDVTPDAGKTSASRQTFVSGMAAKRAATALRRKIFARANVAELASLRIGQGAIILADGENETRLDLAGLPTDEFGYVFRAEETYDPPTKPLDKLGQGSPYATYGYGAQIVELTVDTKLGTVKLDRITAAHDVGRAINPMLVEGQIEGGIAQGIGMALMEDYVPGRTENLHDYLIPTIGDMPEMDSIIIEVEDPEGPYGAKGLGEHVLIPTAPAILNAIRHATGAIIRDLPATPDKVYAAIKGLKRT